MPDKLRMLLAIGLLVYSITGCGSPTAPSSGPAAPIWLNDQPLITSAVYDGATHRLAVSVTDIEGDDVMVSISDIDGLSAYPMEAIVTGGAGEVLFNWCADDQFAGGYGTTTITLQGANANHGEPGLRTVVLNIPAIEVNLGDRHLTAIPVKTLARVGETVTVVVMTGPFPELVPFLNMDSVAVTVTAGGDYVDDSLNIGAIGGSQQSIDGVWSSIVQWSGPPERLFYLSEDSQIHAQDAGEDSSLSLMQFFIFPQSGRETTTGGELFNFCISFDHPGEYQLGFLAKKEGQRTFYTDATPIIAAEDAKGAAVSPWPKTKFCWNFLDTPGVTTSITVVE